VAFGGALAATLGLDQALADAGWTRDLLAGPSQAVNPTSSPALAPERIVSVLGETDRWVPYEDGEALVRQWRLPDANVFRYRLGHLGTPVQLVRDSAPFGQLRRVLAG
jgi:predicted esterase